MTAPSYDPTLKDLVEAEPASWPELLDQPRAPTRVIDADIATVSGAADKVLHVAAAEPYLLHLEFVSGHDVTALPRKLHVRNGLLEDRHDMLVRSGVILLKPDADSPQLTGTYQRAFAGEEPYLTFRYQVVRVWQLAPGPLLGGGLGLMPLALISAVTEADLPGIMKRMERRLRGRRARRKQVQTVWAAAYVLLGLRYSRALAAQLFRGVLSMRESSTYQAILEEGRNEGRTEGRNEGRTEGRNEGRTEGAVTEVRKLLREWGAEALGPPDAPTAALIEGISDLGRLEDLLHRLRTASSWQELLSQQTPARPRGRRRRSP